MIEVFIANINDVSIQTYKNFLLKLPEKEQQKVLKYHQIEDRQRTLLGKMLLYDYLEKYTSSNLLDIKHTKYHKPYIDNSNINFNISHSGKYAVCAFSAFNPIGVDIEEISPTINIDDFKDFFLKSDFAMINNSSNPLKKFYTIWTKKEAILKAEGKGLFDDIKKVQILGDKISFENRDYFTYSYEIDNHIISLIYPKKENINFFRFSSLNLYRTFFP